VLVVGLDFGEFAGRAEQGVVEQEWAEQGVEKQEWVEQGVVEQEWVEQGVVGQDLVAEWEQGVGQQAGSGLVGEAFVWNFARRPLPLGVVFREWRLGPGSRS